MSDKYVKKESFCRVSKDRNGKPLLWLNRLFDIEDNELKEISFDEDSPYMYENRRTFCVNRNDIDVEEGSFGVWQWTARTNVYDNDKDYTSGNPSATNVIEVVIVGGASTIKELIKRMRVGISKQPVCSQVLFCFKANSGKIEGVLCQDDQIIKSNGKTRFHNTVNNLPLYPIDDNDILYLPNDTHSGCNTITEKRFYRKLTLPDYKELVRVKEEPFEIIRDIIIRRTSITSALVKTLKITRDDRKNLHEILNKLPSDDLISEITSECRCSEDEAKRNLDIFLSKVAGYISIDNYDNEVFVSILEEHPELMEKYESIVSERWKEEHKDITSKIEEKRAELKSLANEINLHEEKLSKIEHAVADQERLLTNVSEKVKERIDEARKDAASFVSEMLLISAIKGSENYSIAQTPILLKGSKIDTEERNNDYKDAIMSLATDLKNVGIARDYSRAFAAFLYSAYINHVPVLLAGPNARDISDAFSAALFGKTAGVIDCSGPYRTEVINEITESDDEIFTIKNALRNEWITHVPELLSLESKYFFIAHPFAEDLLIEPKTLFTYTMPILTELIVTAKPKGQLVGAVRASDFEEYQKKDIEAQKDLERVLKSLGTGTLVRSQLQSVLADFHSIHSEEKDLDCLFAVFPYAFISGLPLRQAFEMLTGKMGISKDISEELKSFIGISDE